MERRVTHFARDALVVACCYATLIAVGWIAVGFGGALIAAIGAGALITLLLLPPVVIHYEEQQLFRPRRRVGR